MGLSGAVSQPQRHRGTCPWTSPLLGRGLPDARELMMSWVLSRWSSAWLQGCWNQTPVGKEDRWGVGVVTGEGEGGQAAVTFRPAPLAVPTLSFDGSVTE